MHKPDTITVIASRRLEILADIVNLHVTTKGSTLVTGKEALTNARDVAQQFAALRKLGIEQEDLAIKGIYSDGVTGTITRDSSAIYQLRIRCRRLDALPDVLGLITPQRHARLASITWRCSDERKRRDDCLRDCLTEARERAELIAEGLGVKLLGVQTLSERWEDSEAEDEQGMQSAARQVTTREQAPSVGFPLFHSKIIVLSLKVVFRISDFSGAGV